MLNNGYEHQVHAATSTQARKSLCNMSVANIQSAGGITRSAERLHTEDLSWFKRGVCPDCLAAVEAPIRKELAKVAREVQTVDWRPLETIAEDTYAL